MNTTQQQKAHECAERGTHYYNQFRKQKRNAIITALITIPLGLFTLPLGVFFVFIGGASVMMACVAHVLAKQAHKEFFDIRDDILRDE